ncbi:hypothetical protein ABBQ38_011108 [Trebouxia sp. C0009 RCD-2024]
MCVHPRVTNHHAAEIEREASEMPDFCEWTAAERAKLLNVCTFGAKYLSCGQKDLGMSFHAYCSFKHLSEAFELPGQTAKQCQYLETVVPPATAWILLAGQKIYKLCECNQTVYHSLEQWADWERSFDKVAAVEGLQSSVKHNALQAWEEMYKIEGKL